MVWFLPTCSRWPLRLSLAVLAYIASTYMLYEVAVQLDLATMVGVETLIAIVFYNSMVIASSLASSLVILYSTGSVIAMSGVPLSLLMISISSPYRLVLLTSLLVTLIIVGAVVFVQQARGRLAEPVFDFTYKPRLSPTALAAAAVTLYTSWSLISPEGSCEPVVAVYAIASLVAAVIASFSSYTILESLIVGGLAGLGPLGLVVTASYASLKPLKLEGCKGVEVGELLGFTEVASRSRALLAVAGGARGSFMVCSQPSKAVLDVEEPWILWVYGLNSRVVAESVALKLGGGVVLDLDARGPQIAGVEEALKSALNQASSGGLARVGLGGVEPLDVRLALLPSLVEALGGVGVLVLELTELQRDALLKLVFEVSRRHGRLIVALPEIPWGREMLAPRGPARSSAFIVTRLSDPLQADIISKALLHGHSERVRDVLLDGTIFIAYPGCGGRIIAFKPSRAPSPSP